MDREIELFVFNEMIKNFLLVIKIRLNFVLKALSTGEGYKLQGRCQKQNYFTASYARCFFFNFFFENDVSRNFAMGIIFFDCKKFLLCESVL